MAERKTGGTSPLSGDANVLSFSVLPAGKMAYKLSEWLGRDGTRADSTGVCPAGVRPLAGASMDDIVDVLRFTAAKVVE